MTRTNAYKDLLSNLKRREGLLRIFMLTVFTAFCWVGFSIFLSQQKTKIPASTRALGRPLSPAIDTQVLDNIAKRRRFTDSELQAFPLFTKEVDADGVTTIVQIQDTPTQTSLTASDGATTGVQNSEADSTDTSAETAEQASEEDAATLPVDEDVTVLE